MHLPSSRFAFKQDFSIKLLKELLRLRWIKEISEHDYLESLPLIFLTFPRQLTHFLLACKDSLHAVDLLIFPLAIVSLLLEDSFGNSDLAARPYEYLKGLPDFHVIE